MPEVTDQKGRLSEGQQDRIDPRPVDLKPITPNLEGSAMNTRDACLFKAVRRERSFLDENEPAYGRLKLINSKIPYQAPSQDELSTKDKIDLIRKFQNGVPWRAEGYDCDDFAATAEYVGQAYGIEVRQLVIRGKRTDGKPWAHAISILFEPTKDGKYQYTVFEPQSGAIISNGEIDQLPENGSTSITNEKVIEGVKKFYGKPAWGLDSKKDIELDILSKGYIPNSKSGADRDELSIGQARESAERINKMVDQTGIPIPPGRYPEMSEVAEMAPGKVGDAILVRSSTGKIVVFVCRNVGSKPQWAIDTNSVPSLNK